MNLQLLSSQVDELKLDKIDINTDLESDFNLEFGAAFASELADTFQVQFNMKLNLKESGADNETPCSHHLQIKYVSTFLVSENITDEFINSHFPKVNAPAIAYPFLRAFVGTFLLNSGYETILLPSFNFSAMAKK